LPSLSKRERERERERGHDNLLLTSFPSFTGEKRVPFEMSCHFSLDLSLYFSLILFLILFFESTSVLKRVLDTCSVHSRLRAVDNQRPKNF
jgi:hypothetical protein